MAHITFDASAKLKMVDVKGLRYHVERKYKNHKNPNVDVSRSHLNVDYTPRLLDDLPDNPGDRINARLEDRTGKLQENHIILRPLILQPSPEIFDGMTEQEQQAKMDAFVRDVMPWIIDKFGGLQNIMSVISHLDEKHPHLHVSILPMTVEGMSDKNGKPIKPGRIAQTAFFTGPKQLGILHRELREYMNKKGWGFELENKHEGKQTRATEKQMRDFGPQILLVRDEQTALIRGNRTLKENNKQLAETNTQLAQQNEDLGALTAATAQAHAIHDRVIREIAEAEEAAREAEARRLAAETQATATEQHLKALQVQKERTELDIWSLNKFASKTSDDIKSAVARNKALQEEIAQDESEDSLLEYAKKLKHAETKKPFLTPDQLNIFSRVVNKWKSWRAGRAEKRAAELDKNAKIVQEIEFSTDLQHSLDRLNENAAAMETDRELDPFD